MEGRFLRAGSKRLGLRDSAARPSSACAIPWGGESLQRVGGSSRSVVPTGCFRPPSLAKASFLRAGDQKQPVAFATSCLSFAEAEGFEPPGRCRPTVFKTAAIDHSATPPSESRIGDGKFSNYPVLNQIILSARSICRMLAKAGRGPGAEIPVRRCDIRKIGVPLIPDVRNKGHPLENHLKSSQYELVYQMLAAVC